MNDPLVYRLAMHTRVERLILEGKREDDEMRYKVRALRQHAALIDEAADEIGRLTRWQREATAVIERWEAMWEAAGCPGQLGDAKSDAVRNLVAELRNEIADLRALRDHHQRQLIEARAEIQRLERVDL